MRNRMAVPDRSVTERERKNVAISTQIAVEGIVLLENKGVLPLSKNTKTIALFGSGARRTVKGGTGSGDVNTRDYVTVEQGLKNAGFQIVTDAWLSAQETAMLREFLDAASALADRASRSEIKVQSTVHVAALQKTLDQKCKALRELDACIQAANWTTELDEKA